jgi:hypothetical protein
MDSGGGPRTAVSSFDRDFAAFAHQLFHQASGRTQTGRHSSVSHRPSALASWRSCVCPVWPGAPVQPKQHTKMGGWGQNHTGWGQNTGDGVRMQGQRTWGVVHVLRTQDAPNTDAVSQTAPATNGLRSNPVPSVAGAVAPRYPP